jgi:hypothetical protein
MLLSSGKKKYEHTHVCILLFLLRMRLLIQAIVGCGARARHPCCSRTIFSSGCGRHAAVAGAALRRCCSRRRRRRPTWLARAIPAAFLPPFLILSRPLALHPRSWTLAVFGAATVHTQTCQLCLCSFTSLDFPYAFAMICLGIPRSACALVGCWRQPRTYCAGLFMSADMCRGISVT